MIGAFPQMEGMDEGMRQVLIVFLGVLVGVALFVLARLRNR